MAVFDIELVFGNLLTYGYNAIRVVHTVSIGANVATGQHNWHSLRLILFYIYTDDCFDLFFFFVIYIIDSECIERF